MADPKNPDTGSDEFDALLDALGADDPPAAPKPAARPAAPPTAPARPQPVQARPAPVATPAAPARPAAPSPPSPATPAAPGAGARPIPGAIGRPLGAGIPRAVPGAIGGKPPGAVGIPGAKPPVTPGAIGGKPVVTPGAIGGKPVVAPGAIGGKPPVTPGAIGGKPPAGVGRPLAPSPVKPPAPSLPSLSEFDNDEPATRMVNVEELAGSTLDALGPPPQAPAPVAEPPGKSSGFFDDEDEQPTRLVDSGALQAQADLLAKAKAAAEAPPPAPPPTAPVAPPPLAPPPLATPRTVGLRPMVTGVKPPVTSAQKPVVPAPAPAPVPPPPTAAKARDDAFDVDGIFDKLPNEPSSAPAEESISISEEPVFEEAELSAEGTREDQPTPPSSLAAPDEEAIIVEEPIVESTPPAAVEAEEEAMIEVEEPAEAPTPPASESAQEDEIEMEADESPSDEPSLEEDQEMEIEVEESNDDAVEADRGALLAATVTSRRQALENISVAYAADARSEAAERVAFLEAEASLTDDLPRAAEMFSIAGELAECVLGDVLQARDLYEKAYERNPTSLFVLRALRRLSIDAGALTRALEYADEELALSLPKEEADELQHLSAELAARETAAMGEARWEQLASGPDARAALARLFVGGSRRSPEAMGEALGVLGEVTTGTLGGAINLARARLAEGSAEGDTALSAVQAAAQRDPSDVGAWLAMARIAIKREISAKFREALAGLINAGEGSAVAFAAVALDRSLAGVLNDAVPATALPSPGVEGWLVAHALRDAGLDETPQVQAALDASNDDEAKRAGWLALRSESDEQDGPEVGRFLALRRAVANDPLTVPARAAGLLEDNTGHERAGLRAALLARKGELSAEEAPALDVGNAPSLRALAGSLRAGSNGLDAAEAQVPPGSEGALQQLSGIERSLRDETTAAQAREEFEVLTAAPVQGLGAYASRELARLEGTAAAISSALASEMEATEDPSRSASLRFLTAALRAGHAGENGAALAAEAVNALPAELSAAELLHVYALRGEVAPADAGNALAKAIGDASTPALRMAAVRSALRRGEAEPEEAANALANVWEKQRKDGALALLLLRSLPYEEIDRRIAVLRDLAERPAGEAPGGAVASWTLLAQVLSDVGRAQEAGRALAKARSFALSDPALLAWEEALWLRAGMFAEVAERSFDALKAAETDEARIAAYEKLAELDSTFRNDVASAVLTYQAILELAPGHMPSLRTLERYFLEQGRMDELAGIYERLARHVSDPEDATAIAHAAARIAVKQADGEVGAGGPFWAIAFERGAADFRATLAMESESRRTADGERFVQSSLRAETLATDPQEKACFALRASETLLGMGRTQEALEHLERAAQLDPRHPTVWSWVAFAREALGNAAGAAEALETHGQLSPAVQHATSAWLRAAILWQDKVDDKARARIALERVLDGDPGNTEAFPRALRLLKDQGDQQAELLRIVGRLELGGAEELLPLYLRAAELQEELGEEAAARGSLQAALELDPEQQPALRALARLSQAAGDWSVAAHTRVQLAQRTEDENERVELFQSLGEIYDDQLKEPTHAENAYKRVLELRAREPRALTRLIELYARTNNPEAEAAHLEQLISVHEAGAERRGLMIRLAGVLNEKLSQPSKAEETLEVARREAPADMDVLRAFARLYVRQQNMEALQGLLDRAATEVRRQLDAKPTEASLLELLADILKLRGRVDGARVVSAVANALDVESEKLAPLSKDGAVPGVGANALSQESLELLAPPSISVAHRELLRIGGDLLEKIVPFEPGAMRAEKLGARPHPLRAEAEKWARTFGLESIELYVGPPHPLVVLPVGRHPPAIMLPADLKDTPANRFALVRAIVLVSLSMPLLVRLQPTQLTLVMTGVLRQFEPMFTNNEVDAARLADISRRMTATFQSPQNRPRTSEMSPHAFDVIGRKGTDGEALQAGAIELGTRLAVLASGDIGGAVIALTPGGVEPAEAALAVPPVARLVRVAISDRFLEARHLGGADRRPSSG